MPAASEHVAECQQCWLQESGWEQQGKFYCSFCHDTFANGQQWWNAAWRREMLRRKSSARKTVNIDEDEINDRLDNFLDSGDVEVIWRDEFSCSDLEIVKQLVQPRGLYFKQYGRGTNTVYCLSREELPDYRADLDARFGSLEAFPVIPQRERSRLMELLEEHGGEEYTRLGSRAPQRGQRSGPRGTRRRIQDGTGETSRLDEELQAEFEKRQTSSASQEMRSCRQRLPAFSQQEALLTALSKTQVLVVSGETGCGKTTQVPQFILDDAASAGRGGSCKIVCTQPRRISAVSVAERVAAERCEEVGDRVGWQVRLEDRRSERTRLLFCTTGVLLRQLASDPMLEGVSHVIVDEIHERGINEDFLLIVLRELLPQRRDLKVVLMSATLNAEVFGEYFAGAPSLHIPGYTFDVQELFLEDFLEETGYQVKQDSDKGRGKGGSGSWRRRAEQQQQQQPVDVDRDFPDYSPSTRESLRCFGQPEASDKLDLELVEEAVVHVALNREPGAILCFLTGFDDIKSLHQSLTQHRELGQSSRFLILPLHSQLPTVNQRAVFQRPPSGVRKIVLATNIAETSITIDDVVWVIDAGKAKAKTYDSLNNIACLLPAWISKAAAKQRRGRAGRVQEGFCIHLYTRPIMEQREDYEKPEILRTPLEELVLQIKSLKLGLAAPFLKKALEPPEERAVTNAVSLLRTVGALDEEEELTALGQHLARLPMNPRLGKMLVMGCLFSCLDPVLTMAAAFAHKIPFVCPIDKKNEADKAKRALMGDAESDHIAVLNAYDGWLEARKNGWESEFVRQNYLSFPVLKLMFEMRKQLLQHLVDAGLVDDMHRSRHHSSRQDRLGVVLSVVSAGLYPNVAYAQGAKRQAKLRTKSDGVVKLHPGSALSWTGDFQHNWLVYSEKQKSTDIFLFDASAVSDFALLLLGGDLDESGANTISMLNGWVTFHFSKPGDADIVKGTRWLLDSALSDRISAREGEHGHGCSDDILGIVADLLEAAHKQGSGGRGYHGGSGNWGNDDGGSGGYRGAGGGGKRGGRGKGSRRGKGGSSW